MAANRAKRGDGHSEPGKYPIGLSVVSGIIWGLAIGLVLSLWATVVYLFAGQEAFEEVDITYGQAVLLYLGGGLVIGVLFGLARPWIRGNWSAAAFGFVAGCVGFSMISLTSGPFDPLLVVLCGSILGPAVGWKYWNMFGT